MNQLPNYQRVA